MHLNSLWKQNEQYDGVRLINIYLLRLLYCLIFVFVGKDSWTFILTNIESASPMEAVTWSVWASFSVMALLGIFKPLKMLPIIMLEILYKLIWLAAVALPLWQSNRLAGSSAEGLTYIFLFVLLPLVAVPWGYVFRTYILPNSRPAK